METRFRDHYELATLPYFDLTEDRRLVLSDPEFGPSIDVHTHLALSYIRPFCTDLRAEHPHTEHYLPLERDLDLDVYLNKNFSPWDLKRMTRDLTWRSATSGGMRRTHTLPNLLREMAALGIAHAALLPVELPLLSRNAETYLGLTRECPEVICFGSVHPYEWRPLERLEAQKARGARAVKIHPAVQMIYPHAPRAMRVYRKCGELGLPVFWHCGPVDIEPAAGRRRSQVRYYEEPIAELPDTTFILGHSGALQPELALGFANKYGNAWLDLASQSLPVIRTLLERGPQDRIMMGSDWPFYHQATALAKVLIATEGDKELRRKVLFGNAGRLFGIA
jgi:uncharacterized protein